jgi:hypothetical protein
MDKEILKTYIEYSNIYYYKNTINFDKIIENNNEYNIKLEKNGKYIFITFADTLNNNRIGLDRMQNVELLKNKLQNNKNIDEVIVYNLNDIDDDFKHKHKNLFKSSKYFAWISKVYLIYKKLQEIDENDILLWVDSDLIDIKEKGTNNLFSLCENSEKGIVGFHNNFWLEQMFTKRALFDYLNMNDNIYYETSQIYGGIVLLKKNIYTCKIIKEWYDICLIEHLFNNTKSINEHHEFVEHKNCQSIFSLLLKKYNIKTYPIPITNIDNNDIIAINAGYFNIENNTPLVWGSGWHKLSKTEQMYIGCNTKLKNKGIIIPESTMLISLKYLKQYLRI